ncbi:MAG: bifunctional folylpolyglutamate synthase/dihydrofolate synthase, partial [Lachnospiraceae bacterium]|nr:bifunctional folylpolyglutamate synthase/dihydrofolate synthase [Lachnospiraceae bacterium]
IIVYIMGMLKDKECERVVAETCAYAEQIITVTPPDNPRALSAMALAQIVREYHPHVTAAGSLEEGVEMAYLLADKADVILCFGSLSYLGRLAKVVEERQKNRR